MSLERSLQTRAGREIRPDKRDFGYALIGLALGIAVGGTFAHASGAFLIVLTIGLSSSGGYLIRASKR